MTTDPFAPIGGKGAPGKPAQPDKVAILPVPADAPKPPAQHPQLGRPAGTWTYLDDAGGTLGFVHRFDTEGGKEFRPLVLFRIGDRQSWRWESWPAPRPLYGLDRLAARPAAPVVVTEGEKACDAAGRLLPDHVNVTSPNGSKSAGKADWSALKGRHVAIWPDADEAGTAYAKAVASALTDIGAASVSVATPPAGVKAGWDAADAEVDGWDSARCAALVAAKAEEPKPKAEKRRRRRSAAGETTLGLTEDCDLWHDELGEAYATFPLDGHRESWAVRSKAFQKWLVAATYAETKMLPGEKVITDTIRYLEAKATVEGIKQSPWRRVGQRGDTIYLDLCDDEWRAIEITSRGWRILENHDLPFVRSPAMQALPAPEGGGSIDELRRFINVAGDADFVLVVSWLMAALRPRGPYPMLVVNGQQGSGKSTFTRLLRTLTDPNSAPIRAAPRDDRDMIVAAVNAHVIALDNISKVEPWLSDGLCRLATGGGFSTRALHTDHGEVVFMGSRPIILNGIPMLTERPDLAERAINVRLQAIPEDERRTEDEFWQDWETVAPNVLGVLCDAVSTALRLLPTVKLERMPRLADFAKWMVAAETGLGWEEGSFRMAYDENRHDLVDTTFEADQVAVAIRDMMRIPAHAQGWQGTATDLLDLLNDQVTEAVKRTRLWPGTAQSLGNRIERVAPLLRSKGIAIQRRHSGVRTITIALLEA